MDNEISRLSEFKVELKSVRKQIPFWSVDNILLILWISFLLTIIIFGSFILFNKYDYSKTAELVIDIIGLLYFSLIVFGIGIFIFGSRVKSIILWLFKILKVDTTRTNMLYARRNELHKLIKDEKWRISIEDIKKETKSNTIVESDTKKIPPVSTFTKQSSFQTTNQKQKDITEASEIEQHLEKIAKNKTPISTAAANDSNTITAEESLDKLFATTSKQKEIDSKEKKSNPIKKSFEEYLEDNKLKQTIGYEGEILVLNYEKRILKSKNREDLANMVQHVSIEIGDGLGYDIISFDEFGEKRFIEVKTTTKKVAEGFYITDAELMVLKSMENYHIYRVFEFDMVTKQGLIFKISSVDDFNKYFTIVPITYKVTPKT